MHGSLHHHKIIRKDGNIMRLKFNNDENFYFVSQCQSINNNMVRLFGKDVKQNISGFILYDDNIEFPGVIFNGEDHTTISNVKEEYVEFSTESLEEIFETAKNVKITESKVLLSQYLETHPLKSDCHGKIEAEYNVTTEKQALMSSNYLSYTIAKAAGLDPKLTWNASGQECEEWTEEEYIALLLQISQYVKPLVSLQQAYEVAINNCKSMEELDSINIVYDVYGVSVNE